MKSSLIFSCGLLLAAAGLPSFAQSNAVPAWSLPGGAGHTQVAPPTNYHAASVNFQAPIGVFDGQSDIGGPFLPGTASFDSGKGEYTITAAGYNIWYTRDEFRFLWKKMSGDVSLAANVNFPDPKGYGDRKAVVIIRQSLDDDAKEALAALHGAGMLALAQRPATGLRMKDMEYTIGGRGRPGGSSPDSLVKVNAQRIGIEKHGDEISLWASLEGEPMHQFGAPVQLHLEEPFYVGIGFCSHQPTNSDTAILSNIVLENSAGRVR